MLHSLFTSWASNSILDLLACIYDKQLTPSGALHRPSTKYSFNGAIHDACEEGKDGIRRPLRPLLASWDRNRFVSLQLGRVSPKIYLNSFVLEPICDYIYVWLHCEYACILKYGVVVVVFNGRCFNKRYEVCISVLF